LFLRTEADGAHTYLVGFYSTAVAAGLAGEHGREGEIAHLGQIDLMACCELLADVFAHHAQRGLHVGAGEGGVALGQFLQAAGRLGALLLQMHEPAAMATAPFVFQLKDVVPDIHRLLMFTIGGDIAPDGCKDKPKEHNRQISQAGFNNYPTRLARCSPSIGLPPLRAQWAVACWLRSAATFVKSCCHVREKVLPRS